MPPATGHDAIRFGARRPLPCEIRKAGPSGVAGELAVWRRLAALERPRARRCSGAPRKVTIVKVSRRSG
jgi:hypothetical protein